MSSPTSTALMNCDSASLLAACPVCGGQHSRPLIERSGVPVFCNVLSKTREEARRAERGRLRLLFCPTCGMIYNAAFDPRRVTYSGNYENAQHFSPRFRQYLEESAARLVAKYGLARKDIVEIGCGDARFLSLLCVAGENRGFGFDPAAPENPAGSDDAGISPANAGISVVRELYTESHTETPADFVCCRHVLEHVYQPREFLTTVRRTLGDRTDSVVYFEVPNALSTLRDLGIWDLLYEHCLYFSEPSLSALFTQCGFDVLDVREAFDGQFLCVEAKPAGGDPQRWDAEQTRRLLTEELAGLFESHYTGKVRQWEERLQHLFEQKQKVAVWGAGTKGVMFLNSVAGGERVQCVVDVNPRKTGCYVAGTGQQIVSPARLGDVKPDVVLIMNEVYADEIRAELRRAGLNARIMFV